MEAIGENFNGTKKFAWKKKQEKKLLGAGWSKNIAMKRKNGDDANGHNSNQFCIRNSGKITIDNFE